jgi:hypothetical protein
LASPLLSYIYKEQTILFRLANKIEEIKMETSIEEESGVDFGLFGFVNLDEQAQEQGVKTKSESEVN